MKDEARCPECRVPVTDVLLQVGRHKKDCSKAVWRWTDEDVQSLALPEDEE